MIIPKICVPNHQPAIHGTNRGSSHHDFVDFSWTRPEWFEENPGWKKYLILPTKMVVLTTQNLGFSTKNDGVTTKNCGFTNKNGGLNSENGDLSNENCIVNGIWIDYEWKTATLGCH